MICIKKIRYQISPLHTIRKDNVDNDDPVILSVGTCALHCVHNAYKNAMKKNSNWNIVQFLRAIHYLFNNTPARREDYIKYGGSALFPLKFCAVRWLENVQVAERTWMPSKKTKSRNQPAPVTT